MLLSIIFHSDGLLGNITGAAYGEQVILTGTFLVQHIEISTKYKRNMLLAKVKHAQTATKLIANGRDQVMTRHSNLFGEPVWRWLALGVGERFGDGSGMAWEVAAWFRPQHLVRFKPNC